jgi:malate dehydrogenase (oxaloacetate-decarboxylating)(NADP+)
VAAPCEEIVKDPAAAFKYTSRGNLVAVITNGTAVLGLGDIGPLAGKPVMEGKGVLFKKFCRHRCVRHRDQRERTRTSWSRSSPRWSPPLAPSTWKTSRRPDCFYVERKLRERMKIPVFHDDQHGTAITGGGGHGQRPEGGGQGHRGGQAGGLGRRCRGAGLPEPAGQGGLKRENVWVTDLAGVVYEGRTELMDEDKILSMPRRPARTLAEVIEGADVFLGLSAGGVLKPDMVAKMAARPVIFALANPNPEIRPKT